MNRYQMQRRAELDRRKELRKEQKQNPRKLQPPKGRMSFKAFRKYARENAETVIEGGLPQGYTPRKLMRALGIASVIANRRTPGSARIGKETFMRVRVPAPPPSA